MTHTRSAGSEAFPSLVTSPPSIAFDAAVAAFHRADYSACMAVADAHGDDLATQIVATLASFYRYFEPETKSERARRIAGLACRSESASPGEAMWIRYIRTIGAERTSHCQDHLDEVRSVRDAARDAGIADVASYAHLSLMERAYIDGDPGELEALAAELDSASDMDALARWRGPLTLAWQASDLGDDENLLACCLTSFDRMERLPYRHAYYEAITLRETAHVAHETDRLGLIRRVASHLDARAWPPELDFYHGVARYHVASMYFLHGARETARGHVERGLAAIALPWARLRLQTEQVRIASAVPVAAQLATAIAALCDAAEALVWEEFDRAERLLLLEIAALVHASAPAAARRFRERFRRARTMPERLAVQRGEIKTLLGERMLSGIAAAAAGHSYEAIAKLSDAIVAWQTTVRVPWRAAVSAYHLARVTGAPRDIANARALLNRWPDSPFAARIACETSYPL